ncbi:hypothetical protein ma71 [Moumouvirus australiensis]|uniref:Uncharacterized protein n=1 Tax=Moumouvirus australiensis TaxID=2109587 RepID=A0A2P1EKP8_9VIRU|nr:hypothetical protein QKC55_gp832 [Moumouvirus australiensis]AVL94458.1 hypothetical protein ma71 [Moumouvirus australiensis]
MSVEHIIQDPFATLMEKGYNQQLRIAVRNELISYARMSYSEVYITDNDVDFFIEKYGDSFTEKDLITFMQYKLFTNCLNDK